MRPAVKPSLRILHSSPVEEKKLGSPFSEDGPSAIQGEGVTLAFSDLREWDERGVTTPNLSKFVAKLCRQDPSLFCRSVNRDLYACVNIPMVVLVPLVHP